MKRCLLNKTEEHRLAWLIKKRASNTAYRLRNKEKVAAARKRYKSRPEVRKLRGLYRKLSKLMKSKFTMTVPHSLVGCSAAEFKVWIETKFKDGMTWGNYGSHWEIDHKRPCSTFNVMDPVEALRCFHYTNLQPLLKHENRFKSHKLNAAALFAGPRHQIVVDGACA